MTKTTQSRSVPIFRHLSATAVFLALVLLALPVLAQKEPTRRVNVAAGTLSIETIATGLHLPWGLVFLPNGDMLVSEKHPARLRRISKAGEVSAPLDGLPEIYESGNGGLLGLALHPGFDENQQLYFAFSEPGEGNKAGLSVARARLQQNRISDVEVIFRQTPKIEDERNFGGRLTFAPDGNLFVMTGDRFAQDLVQDLGNTIGALVRIKPNGDVPADNPFVGQDGIVPTVWSATSKAGQYIRRQASSGLMNSAPGAAMSSTFPRPGTITGGRL